MKILSVPDDWKNADFARKVVRVNAKATGNQFVKCAWEDVL